MNAIATHAKFSGLTASIFLHAAVLLLLTFGFSSNRNPIGHMTLGDSVLVELAYASSVSSRPTKASAEQDESIIVRSILSEKEGLVENKESKRKKDELAQSGSNSQAKEEPAPTSSNMTSEPTAGARSGVSGTSGLLGDPNGIEVTERERYLYELRRFIDNRKTYPSISRQLGETGRVTLRVRISRDGSFAESAILSGSAPKRLEASAQQLISSLSRFKSFPNSIADQYLVVEIPIDYVLE